MKVKEEKYFEAKMVSITCYHTSHTHHKTFDIKEVTVFIDPKYIKFPCGHWYEL